MLVCSNSLFRVNGAIHLSQNSSKYAGILFECLDGRDWHEKYGTLFIQKEVETLGFMVCADVHILIENLVLNICIQFSCFYHMGTKGTRRT